MTPQITPLTIDAEQWRRDIKTFAETTNQVLEAIVSQLSNDVSHQEKDLPRDQIRERPKTTTETTVAGSGLPSENRLAELKSQLAQRLSKLN